MFLRITDGNIEFVVEGIHDITETDKKITDEIYNKFFELQSQGKQFKVKNINGTTFEEIFEEVIPVIEQQPQIPTAEQRLKAVESALSAMMGV